MSYGKDKLVLYNGTTHDSDAKIPNSEFHKPMGLHGIRDGSVLSSVRYAIHSVSLLSLSTSVSPCLLPNTCVFLGMASDASHGCNLE